MLIFELWHEIVAYLETQDLHMLLLCNYEWFEFIQNSNEFLYDKLASVFFWKYSIKPKLKQSIDIPRIKLPKIHWVKTLQFLHRKNLHITYIFEIFNRYLPSNYFSEQEQQIWFILMQYNTWQISDGLYSNMNLIHSFSVQCYTRIVQPFLTHGIEFIATDVSAINFILEFPFHSVLFDQIANASLYSILKYYIKLNSHINITDKHWMKLLFGFSMEQILTLPKHLLPFVWYNPPNPSRNTKNNLPIEWKSNRSICLALKLRYSTVDVSLLRDTGFLVHYAKHYPIPTHIIEPLLNCKETVEYILLYRCKHSASVWEMIMNTFPEYTLDCIGASLMDEFSNIHGTVIISKDMINEEDLLHLLQSLPRIHPPQFVCIPEEFLSVRIWKECIKKSAQLINKCSKSILQQNWKQFVDCNQFVYYYLPKEMKKNEEVLQYVTIIATNVSIFDGTKFLTKSFWANLLQKDMKGTFPTYYLEQWIEDYDFMKQVVTHCAVSDLIYSNNKEMVTLQLCKNPQLYLLLDKHSSIANSWEVCNEAMAKQISLCELPAQIVERKLLLL